VFLCAAAVWLLADSHLLHRIVHDHAWRDRRFSFWIPGLKVMLHYPFGGGHHLYVGRDMKLAHNTFIDIGKDFGILPFLSVVALLGWHLPKFTVLLKSRSVPSPVKAVTVTFAVALGTMLMIEPVFTSDKIYFSYAMFVLGIIGAMGTSAAKQKHPIVTKT
jgi:O-antigen ligase